WRFEESDPSYPDVAFELPELLKTVVVDFAIESGVDWFQIPYKQPLGTIARVESLIVRDVFGRRTIIDRADPPDSAPGLTRWTMFGMARGTTGLAKFNIVPPSAGNAALVSAPIEQVRFAR